MPNMPCSRVNRIVSEHRGGFSETIIYEVIGWGLAGSDLCTV